jgi:hypothetical protein
VKYYIGALDSEGAYCVPRRGPRRTLDLAGTKHLVSLAPGEPLYRQYEACLAIRSALASGELPDRTRRSLKTWANTPERQLTARHMLELLQGKTLEQAEGMFEQAYRRELQGNHTWAALSWLAADPEPELVADIPATSDVVLGIITQPILPLRGNHLK